MGSKVVIALRHTCSESQSSTWEVKSIKVQEGKAPEEGGSETPDGTYIDQDFSSSLGSFTSQSASGSLKWYNDYSSAMVTVSRISTETALKRTRQVLHIS